MVRGKELYGELCITCHLADGKGTPGTIPPLAGSSYFAKKITNAIYPQKFGLNEPIVVNGVKYTAPMPPPGISDEEIADITTYITNSWGNKGKLITVKEVQKVAINK
ncbi:MAG: cytochrome c [Chitinophagaceae bacterium]|nr:cytochrome c [Chitinophagaceae bacterium]